MIISESDEQIEACYPLMKQLRPDLVQDEFVSTVNRMMQEEGYVLGYLALDDEVVALAGFRACTNFAANGIAVYIYDLVTTDSRRSKGLGAQLIHDVEQWSAKRGAVLVHLDSSVTRFRAHKFYFKSGYHIQAHHYFKHLKPQAK